jgi:ankyrin repeat protein
MITVLFLCSAVSVLTVTAAWSGGGGGWSAAFVPLTTALSGNCCMRRRTTKNQRQLYVVPSSPPGRAATTTSTTTTAFTTLSFVRCPAFQSFRTKSAWLMCRKSDLDVVLDHHLVAPPRKEQLTAQEQLGGQHQRSASLLPSEQRVTQPRPARRMNHPFKYLYRHNVSSANEVSSGGTTTTTVGLCDDDVDDVDDTMDALQFLVRYGGYTESQVQDMHRTFLTLRQLSIREQLWPKVQFLWYTLGVCEREQARSNGTLDCMSATPPPRMLVPPYYFGIRLERVLAPRHAFLAWLGLPSGPNLWQAPVKETLDTTAHSPPRVDLNSTASDRNHHSSSSLFAEFLATCRNAKQFAALCQSWYQTYGQSSSNDYGSLDFWSDRNGTVTARDVEAFDAMFARGLLAAVRNDLVQAHNAWPTHQLPMATACHVTKLLLSHGANPYARDHRGVTLLHWACGTGHWDAALALLPYFPVTVRTMRDGATPLHWAAAGTTAREFGVGGHVDTCRHLLDHVRTAFTSDMQTTTTDLGGNQESSIRSLNDYVNCLTYDGNSALMWAAWSGTLDTVKLLVRNRANVTVANRNGCTVAHWAASGGNLAVCQYLCTVAQVDFTTANHGGNTPLSHAVAFGRIAVIEWLLSIVSEAMDGIGHRPRQFPDHQAYRLAQDLVQWTNGIDNQRVKVLQLFDDELNPSAVMDGTPTSDDDYF